MQDTLVSTDWLHDRLTDDSVRVLEVGSSDDRQYRLGHVPGATWVFWRELCWDDDVRQFATPAQMAIRLGQLGITNGDVLVVMSDQPQYATYAYWSMTMAGITGVRVLDGSRRAWVAEGRPISVAVEDYPAVDRVTGDDDQSSRVGRDDVLAHLNASNRVVIDARSPEEYSGERVMPLPNFDHGAQRVGRVPGAIHLYYRLLLNDDDTFKTRKEVVAAFEEAGVSLSDDIEIVTYCRLSHRATLVWFALTRIVGFGGVRIYDGSWTEWGSMVGMPIER
ncbi:MAG: sulfurtransferase [Acidimicrobiia bacterium]